MSKVTFIRDHHGKASQQLGDWVNSSQTADVCLVLRGGIVHVAAIKHQNNFTMFSVLDNMRETGPALSLVLTPEQIEAVRDTLEDHNIEIDLEK